MIEVFHLALARSLRVLWLLEEIGAEYSLRVTELPARDDFRELYSAGLLPAVKDNGEILIESMAICELLARRYGGNHLIPGPDSPIFPEYLQWLWFGEATMIPPLSAAFVYSGALPGAPSIPEAAARGRNDFAVRMAVLEERLKGRMFVAGDMLTLADISVGYAVYRSQTVLGEANVIGPNTAAYLERLSARPAFQAASRL